MRSILPITAVYLFAAHTAIADHAAVEEILIEGQKVKPLPLSVENNFEAAPLDSAALLKTLPGANVNSNGPVTGIIQYRGMYGYRIDTHIDNSPALTGGPNSMDAPLSYTPPLLLKRVEIQRGIASVSSGQETLGGHLNVELDRGQFSASDEAELHGTLNTRFNGNTDGGTHAVKTHLANNHHKVAILASLDEGDNTRIGSDETLAGTFYRRNRFDLSYGWQDEDRSIMAFAGRLDTRDTGTPALPMDINFIDGDLAGFGSSAKIGNATVTGKVSYSHVDHVMDNFTHRLPPAPMRHRSSHATARGHSWSLNALWPLQNGSLQIGADGDFSVHNTEITNPNSAMFHVHNFNDVKREVFGLFAEWKTERAAWDFETGIRYNHVESDADPVSTSGMMGMMATNANILASRFNTADRSKNDDNVDMVLKASTSLNSNLNLELGLGIKNRAPSYQERYLWLPMQSTGGLADGRSYIGNLNLDSETSHEINIGLNWTGENGWLSPQVFYRQIDDYIQGVPGTDMTANMLSTMMSGNPALMFDNVDAEMTGLDMAYGYHLSTHFTLEGNLSYVRGENTDSNDDLYRIAPLNNRLALVYKGNSVKLSAESVLYAKQNRVAEYNDEEESSGYGIFNLSAQFELADNLEISAGIHNLFDKRYQDHLAGYNRNGDSDIAVGERLIGTGRNAWLALTRNW